MKKIMFNDKYELTKAVLEGRKTITRRAVPEKLLECITVYAHGDEEELIYRLIANSPYKVGEVVAIAQCYNDVIEEWKKGYGQGFCFDLKDRAGMTNKMFVRSEEMPHHIKITNIRVEHMQNISDKDCLREAVVKNTIGYYVDGLRCKDWEKESHVEMENGDTLKLFPTPREAFATLIDKLSGRGTWESNPYVWVYEFELVD